MPTFTYPDLAQNKPKKIGFIALLRVLLISLSLLLIVIPFQLIVMIVYAPVAIWNALLPPKIHQNSFATD